MHMLRFNIVRCVFLLFYVLKKHIILYAWIQWCNKTTLILAPPPPSVVGGGYIISNFLMAKEVNNELKLLGLFSYTCMLQNFCFNLYFIYLNLCYSCIICFHFKDWRKWWIIHIASSVMLQNAENVMSKLNIF